MTGIVDRFFDRRGFGFIKPMIGKPDSTPEVFFHVSAVKRGVDGRRQAIPVGAEVRFRLARGNRGPQASDVELVELRTSALLQGDRQENSETWQRRTTAAAAANPQ